MATTFTEQVTLVEMVCGECGITFAMPQRFQEERLERPGSFYCPNGHCRTYRETEIKRLRRELEESKADFAREREAHFAEQRAHEQTQKKVKQVHRRVSNGVCPCCHRTFKQLSAHMKIKHPAYVATAEIKP